MQARKLAGTHFSNTQPKECIYRRFTDYTNLVQLPDSDPLHARVRYTATLKQDTSQDPNYTNRWYILMRYGEYGAQVEKAMSDIYRHFLGYSTEIEIVKHEGDFYAASHEINHFVTFEEAEGQEWLVIENNELLFLHNGKKLPVIGVGKLAVLTEFFHDPDNHSGNWGFQVNADNCRAFRIDNEHALEDEHPDSEKDDEVDDSENSAGGNLSFEDELKSSLSIANQIPQLPLYIQEKEAMRQEIATTDFTVIANYLRKNITSNKIESSRWTLENQAKFVEDTQEIELLMAQLNLAKPEDHNIDSIIAKLKEKHELLKWELCKDLGPAKK